jgi:type II secretory pathway predicted ATPase ExeA
MYKRFYGLSAQPFSLLPDADFLFLSERYRLAVNLLEYGITTRAGFMVITGEVGAGKTTVIRRFLKNARSDVTIGVITNPSSSFGRLLSWVGMAFDFKDVNHDDAMLYKNFVDFLLTQYARGRRTILIIDEAQNLKAEMLEELRMLSNVNNEKDQLLQIVLVGQPELRDTLNRPELRQFVQRVSVHCHIEPLRPFETAGYIRHRLAVAGAENNLFDDTACAAVHYFTGGVPRLINLLCDQALLYGFSEDLPQINVETVVEAVYDRNRAGLSAFKDLSERRPAAGLLNELRPLLNDIRAASPQVTMGYA